MAYFYKPLICHQDAILDGEILSRRQSEPGQDLGVHGYEILI